MTNLGLIYGALAASRWNGPASFKLPSNRRLIAACIAGLVMGYSSRMAFGCNVGAYLGGIASASDRSCAASTRSRKPGRPFFMCMGIRQTSRAPAAISRPLR